MGFMGDQDGETQCPSNPSNNPSYPTTSYGTRPLAMSRGSVSMQQMDPARRTQKHWSNQPNLMARETDYNSTSNSINPAGKFGSYINITSTLKNDIRPLPGSQTATEPRIYADYASKSTSRRLGRMTKDSNYNQSDSQLPQLVENEFT